MDGCKCVNENDYCANCQARDFDDWQDYLDEMARDAAADTEVERMLEERHFGLTGEL